MDFLMMNLVGGNKMEKFTWDSSNNDSSLNFNQINDKFVSAKKLMNLSLAELYSSNYSKVDVYDGNSELLLNPSDSNLQNANKNNKSRFTNLDFTKFISTKNLMAVPLNKLFR